MCRSKQTPYKPTLLILLLLLVLRLLLRLLLCYCCLDRLASARTTNLKHLT